MHIIALSILIAPAACSYPVYETVIDNTTSCIDAAVDSLLDAPIDAAPAASFGIASCGQSNDEGRALCTNVTLAAGACDTRMWAQFWDRDTDSPLDTSTQPFVWQTDRVDTALSPRAGNNFGIELSMADELHANALTFAIAKAAVGSTALAIHWFNHCYTSTTAAADVGCTYHNPQTGIAQPYPSTTSSLRQQCIDQGSKLDAAGFPVKYIIWIQGETDASYALYSQLYPSPINGYVSHYDENLTAWFGQLHAQWPDAVIIFNELDSAMVFNYTANLRAAQEATHARLSYTRMVSSEGLGINSAHFTADGLWVLGQRFADAILAVH